MVEYKKINKDYLISSTGKVYSLKNNKMLSPNECGGNNRNYLKVDLYMNGERFPSYIHQLVGIAFIPNPNGYTEINHKDGNTHNNNVENLEWCDRPYNNKYSHIQERLTEAKKKKVYQYTLDGELVKIWESSRECERITSFKQSAISLCCNGKKKQYKGYKWSYSPL